MNQTRSDVFFGNYLDAMKDIPDKHFDLLVTDPPYNKTKNKWDVIIDLPSMWQQLQRVVKDDGAFIFTSSQPFTTDLINSNRDNFRYDLIWEKSIATGFLNANRMPLRGHEIILVFYRRMPVYHPIKHKLSTRPSFKKAKKRILHLQITGLIPTTWKRDLRMAVGFRDLYFRLIMKIHFSILLSIQFRR